MLCFFLPKRNFSKKGRQFVESRFPLCVSECYALLIYSWRSYLKKQRQKHLETSSKSHPKLLLDSLILLLHIKKSMKKAYKDHTWFHLVITWIDEEGSLFWSLFVSIDKYELREKERGWMCVGNSQFRVRKLLSLEDIKNLLFSNLHSQLILSLPPLPAVVYFCQGGLLFSLENTKANAFFKVNSKFVKTKSNIFRRWKYQIYHPKYQFYQPSSEIHGRQLCKVHMRHGLKSGMWESKIPNPKYQTKKNYHSIQIPNTKVNHPKHKFQHSKK